MKKTCKKFNKNDMQEALQNENFRKVWEAVGISRKKQFESIKRHFFTEYNPLYEKGCIFLYRNILYSVIDFGLAEYWHNNLCKDISMIRALMCDIAQNTLHNIVCEISESAIDNVIGRPITLENILMLIPELNYGNDGIYTMLASFNGSFDHETICDWQLTKPLHEQTPETWEVIANLIQ